MAHEDIRAWETLCELIWGCAIGQAIHVCVELGIPEILNAGSRTSAELAAATGADGWTLEAVARALAAFEVLSVDGDERYALTPMGRLLLRSSPTRSAAEAGELFDVLYAPLGGLLHMVRTGEVAFRKVYGEGFYDHLAERPALAAQFYDLMEANAPQRYAGLCSVYDFSGVSRVVDVGGGESSLLLQLLGECQHMTGTVLDLPVVSVRAQARIEAAGLAARCRFVAGDFRRHVPDGGDLYLLAQVLNNCGDAEARVVLANCRAAMHPGARLLVLEAVAESGPLPRWRALVSLGVTAQRGGRTRSATQLRALLASASLELERIRPLPSTATCVIEAKPALLPAVSAPAAGRAALRGQE